MFHRRATFALTIATWLVGAALLPSAAAGQIGSVPPKHKLLHLYRPLLRYDSAERYFAQPVGHPDRLRRDDRDRVYGHVAVEDGRLWLQYWLFFAQNTQDRGVFRTGRHEGDWELVQIGLAEDGRPEVVTFSQHSSAEACPAAEPEIEIQNLNGIAPVVYVANGSHALYPHAGTADRPFPDPNDEADGAGRYTRPLISVGPGPNAAWETYGGRWGASRAGIVPGEQSSPLGPRFQESGAWQRPATYHAAARLCGSGPPGRWWGVPALVLAVAAVSLAGILLVRRLRG
jgi:hypothetical protein